jgi:hypothetical protein
MKENKRIINTNDSMAQRVSWKVDNCAANHDIAPVMKSEGSSQKLANGAYDGPVQYRSHFHILFLFNPF